jgi:hypothetical protein
MILVMCACSAALKLEKSMTREREKVGTDEKGTRGALNCGVSRHVAFLKYSSDSILSRYLNEMITFHSSINPEEAIAGVWAS